jgi:hypothetical protein
MTGTAADEAVTLMRKLLRLNGLRAPSERWESDMCYLASQSRPGAGGPPGSNGFNRRQTPLAGCNNRLRKTVP